MMKAAFLFILFLTISPTTLLGQNKTEIVNLLNKAQILSYQQPKESLKISNYILKNAVEDTTRSDAYLLISQNELVLGNYQSAINNLFFGKKYNIDANNYKSDLLSSQIFIQFGFPTWSNAILDSLYPKIIDKNDPQLKGDYYKEKSSLLFAQKKFKPALEALEKSIFAYKKLQNDSQKKLLINTCYQQMATIYLKDSQSEKAQNLIDSVNNYSPLLYRTQLLQAMVLSYEKKHEKALDTLKLLMPVKAHVKEIALRLQVYKNLYSEYYALKQIDNYKKFNTKYIDLQDSIVTAQKKAQVFLFSKMNKEKGQSIKNKRRNYYYIICGGIFLALILILFGFLYKRNLNHKYQHFQKLLENPEPVKTLSKTTKNTAPKTIVIPDNTTQLLLKKLKEFEKSEGYLNPKISLILLAKKLETNTKYLSETINNQKQINFHTYINQLRIDYIIQKLKTDKQYLKYKVSYLAKESGFLSHSTFATTFKNLAGISPTNFIKLLKKEAPERNS